MCDEQLGRLLDYMDEKNLWEDTMVIVNTDHGYMLGEHGYWAKNYMLCYDEIVHTPLFIWDPRFPESAGTSRTALVQTIDLPVTILKFFGIDSAEDMQGQDIAQIIGEDKGRPFMRIVWYIWGAYMLYGWKIRIYEGSEKFRDSPS